MKTPIKLILTALVVILVLPQFQPLLLKVAGAVDGTFGVRPVSHQCLGLTLEANGSTSWLPHGQVMFQLGLFHFRYTVTEEDKINQRPICLGQDLWYGE